MKSFFIIIAIVLLSFATQAQECIAPVLQWTNNVLGDTTKIPFKWHETNGCEYYLHGTQEETLTSNSFFFILQPTFTGRDIRENPNFPGVYSIGRPYKLVMIDTQNLTMDPMPPFAPNAFHVKLVRWINIPPPPPGTPGAERLMARTKPKVLPLPPEYRKVF